MVAYLRRLELSLGSSPSTAAALLGCFRIAKSVPRRERALIVTVFADSAEISE
jgi:hypothetical protein